MELGTPFGIANMVVPSGGPKCAPITLDFSNVASILIDAQQIIQNGQIEYLQGVYIDNSNNNNKLTLTLNTTGQIITAPPNSCGYYMIMVPNTPQMTCATTQLAGVKPTLIFYNVPMPPCVWKVT